MAGNKVTLTFAGDADSLAKAAAKAQKSTSDVADAATKSGKEMANASKSGADLGAKMGHLGSAVSGANDAIGGIADGVSALNDLQHAGAERASKLAHAQLDVEKAMNDTEQAARDLRSAQLDLNEANSDGKRAAQDITEAQHDAQRSLLDIEKAQQDYNDAVKEHGRNSYEARDAALAITEAQDAYNSALLDAGEAQDDANRAIEDANQAAQDMATANTDAKDSMLALTDAQRAYKDVADPSTLQGWTEKIQTFAPLITAVVGVVGLATSATWLWNAALWASPITWIVLAVAALVAIIVIVATKTTFFQDTWKAVWGFLKDVGAWFAGPFADFFVKGYHLVMNYAKDLWAYIKSIPDQLKSAFAKVTDFIFAPFRAAFNLVASAWNNTIGRLHWTVPGWVPGVGGNSISAPTLPKFHTGGIVPGGLGAETLAVLQAGERVTPMGGGGNHAEPLLLGSDGSDFGDFLVDQLRKAIARRGGDPARVLGNSRG